MAFAGKQIALAMLACLAQQAAAAGLAAPAYEQARQAARPMRIDVEPVLDNGAPYFKVDLRYQAEAGGTCRLDLPGEWANVRELYKAVRNLHLMDSDVALTEGDGPAHKSFACKAGQPVHLQYELVQDFAGPPTTEGYYRAIVQPQYFHWIGKTAWVLPVGGDRDRLDIDLRWNKLPSDWSLANSFGVNGHYQRIVINRGGWQMGLFVGGDFRIHAEELDGKSIYTAVRGQWKFGDADFAAMVRDTVEVERRFWRTQEGDFLVTMLDLSAPPTATSMGGTGLSSAFALFNTPNVELAQMRWLLTHEYFHTWNPQRLGNMPEPEQAMYWLSEGFTDYYSDLLQLRSGSLSLESYVAKQNELLRKTYLSSAATLPNSRVVKDFWNNHDVEKLPYQRGALLAAAWNGQIRAASAGKSSLDNVLFDLMLSASADDGKRRVLTPQRLANTLNSYTGQDALSLIKKHIDDGELIVPNGTDIGPGVQVVWKDVPRFELGLDLKAIKEQRIGGVVAGSAAYQAGLRDGQTILRRTPILIGDSDQLVEITAQDGDYERTFRYLPRSALTVSVPQFVLPADLSSAQRGGILSWLGASPPVSSQ